ncbi:MAG: hypothetical protein HY332_10455 [Chloroflexi bacterium]|nr:hypothetical protein [Chloroflexota bacterium]
MRDPHKGEPAWRRTFITLCATQTVAMLAFGMALPFLPLYVQRLGIVDPREAARWAGAMSAGGGHTRRRSRAHLTK